MTQKDQCDVACVSNALEHCRERRNKGLAAVLAHLQALPSSSPGFEEGRGDKKKKKETPLRRTTGDFSWSYKKMKKMLRK